MKFISIDQNIDHSIKLFTLPTDNWTQQLESSQVYLHYMLYLIPVQID